MPKTYDIDIQYVMPPELMADPNHAAALKEAGITLNTRGNYVAKFRDPDTAAALKGASDNVRKFFEACGFGFVPSGQDYPTGFFDPQFDNHVTDVAKRLQENLRKFDLRDQDWNGFEFSEFIVSIGNARPMPVKTHTTGLARLRGWIGAARPS